MARVRFLRDVVYETEGPGKGPLFASGSVHDLRDDLAARWVNRGVAVPHVDPPAELALPAEPEPAAGDEARRPADAADLPGCDEAAAKARRVSRSRDSA